VYQERGQWVAQLSIGGRGRRRYVRRTKPNRREALAALAELRDEQHPPSATRVTVGAFLEAWIRSARNLRPATQHAYANAIAYHLAPVIGDVRLAELSPLDVERMLAVVGQSVGAKTLRNVHAVLRRALTMAVRQGLLTRNVAGREFVDAPRVPAEEPRALSVDEVHRLLDAAKGDRLEALFVTALGTGLRQGELLGLAWEDLDLAAGRISVRRELVRRDGRYQRVELKTPQSRRAVPLSPSVVEALAAHRERVIAAKFVPTATGPVFINTDGGPLNGSWLTHHFYALSARAKIPQLPFHNLRTTFSTRLAEAGVSDLEIARLLGHSRIHTAKKHYIAAGPVSEKALEAVEAMVG
jgi:integrase